jgi:ribosomal protein L28
MKFHSDILGRDFSLRISTAGLRTLTKHGGLDAYVSAKPVSRLSEDMAMVKKAIEKKLARQPGGAPKKEVEKKPVRKPNISARLAKKNNARALRSA